MQKLVPDVEGMRTEARAFVDALTPAPDEATIVALSGDLGAGKTTFVKGIAEALGIEDEITSPTFVIEKVYALNDKPWKPWRKLIHIDAYRLAGRHELAPLGWDELIQAPENLVCIEW